MRDKGSPVMTASSRPEMDQLSGPQRDVLDAIAKWYGDGGWKPLTLGGYAGTGKGHPHGTGILTPAGFTPIEELAPGDLVIGSDGQPVKVLNTYRRGVLPVYRVAFSDGSSIRVDGDHLWATRTNAMDWHGGAYRPVETRELACTLRKRWGIPQVSAPVEVGKRDLPIDPYILGVLLGDGSITQARALFTPGDALVPAEVARRLPEELVLRCHRAKLGKADSWCITRVDGYRGHRFGGGHVRNPVVLALDNLGLLGKPAAGKFIPDDYLYASASQRLDVLRGLMDTDGELHTRMSEDRSRTLQIVTQFSSASEMLCNQVQFIIESFGGVARKSVRQAPKYTHEGERRTGQPSYRLNINSTVNPFLTREGWEPHGHRKPKRVIRTIEPDGEAEVTCLRVDAADSLYLAEHCIVTHNTTLVGLLPEVLPKHTQIAYASFTGKAVSVLASKLPPGARLSTIHRLLYQPAVMTLCAVSGEVLRGTLPNCSVHQREPDPCPVTEQVSFTPVAEPLAGIDLVVADEASMIPEQLWADLTSHGVPVLAVGDHGQLPPVKSSFNLMEHPDLRLEEIHRQAAGSPILVVAQWARERGHIPHGPYGPDVIKIRPPELGYTGLHPAEAGMIICATNATRAWHNAAVRSWHGRSGPPAPGDVVICLKNNYDAGLFNGQRGVIAETGAPVMRGTVRACRMTIMMEGLDAPWEGVVALAPFGNPPAAAAGIRDRNIGLFDFGYALTAHRAQGSQADSVIVIEEGWPPPGSEMRRRWLYTSVTRAAKTLTVVG